MNSRPCRSAALLAAMLAALCACKGSGEPGVDAAAELRRLERVLADTADLRTHPVLTDADLEPLRRLRLRDPRVSAARAACIGQYEAIIRAQDEVERCSKLEQAISAQVGAADLAARDPLALIVEAQETCGRAVTWNTSIGRGRSATNPPDDCAGTWDNRGRAGSAWEGRDENRASGVDPGFAGGRVRLGARGGSRLQLDSASTGGRSYPNWEHMCVQPGA